MKSLTIKVISMKEQFILNAIFSKGSDFGYIIKSDGK